MFFAFRRECHLSRQTHRRRCCIPRARRRSLQRSRIHFRHCSERFRHMYRTHSCLNKWDICRSILLNSSSKHKWNKHNLNFLPWQSPTVVMNMPSGHACLSSAAFSKAAWPAINMAITIFLLKDCVWLSDFCRNEVSKWINMERCLLVLLANSWKLWQSPLAQTWKVSKDWFVSKFRGQ